VEKCHARNLSATLFVAQRYLKHRMKLVPSTSRRSVWRLRVLATLLTVAGQFGISGASLTLAHDESSVVSHTERSGIDLHHGHNDATCAACTALSFQATVNPVARPDLER
jgi:RNase P/RNase MRP subunit POP5